MSPKILCVDDDPHILTALQRSLRRDFDLHVATGGEAALEVIQKHGPFAVVIADMRMPGMNGISLLARVRELAPDTVRIMLTGNADQQTAIDAVNRGHVFQFLTKPCPPDRMAANLQAALRHYRLILSERELLERTLNGSIQLLTDILSTTDPARFGRAQAARSLMRATAAALQVPETWELELAAMFAPIGYVALPQPLLGRIAAAETLTDTERDMLVRLPEIGAGILANIPRLESVARMVRYQNKNYDGSGFPADRVARSEIPLGARILKVLNDLSDLEHRRVPRLEALERLRHQESIYDARVVDAVARACGVDLEAPVPPVERPVQSIAFRDLVVGHVLAAGLTALDGTLIAPAGTEVSQVLLHKLHNFADYIGLTEPVQVYAN